MALATYQLVDPVEIKEADGNVRTTETVSVLRKARVKDMKGVNIGGFATGKFTVEELVPVLSRITDAPIKVLEEMSCNDLVGLMEVAQPFFIG